ncbi:MAG: hypothetical protein AAGD38_12670 [Acidobacteriota bacterium]
MNSVFQTRPGRVPRPCHHPTFPTWILFVMWLAAGVAIATPPEPNGGEIAINTTSAGAQLFPTVAMGTDGSFVAAWTRFPPNANVFARRFAADGTPLTGDLAVPNVTTGNQDDASVSIFANGDFVIVWDDDNRDGDQRGIYGRIFAADGTPMGDDFPINATSLGDQNDAVVAVLSNDDFVVAWETPDLSGLGIVARLFDRDGMPIGDEIAVNTFLTGDQEDVAVAADGSGGFVLAWESFQVDGSQDGVVARRFDQAGGPLTGEIAVNTTTAGSQDGPTITSATNGDFVVAWETGGDDVEDVRARFFSADGTPTSDELNVNSTTSGSQEDAWVTLDPSGGAIVVWESSGQDGDGDGVYLRRFTPSGADGDEVQVNVTTAGNQETPVIGTDGSGRYVIVWEDLTPADAEVSGRLFDSWLFADGFESGDTSGWSSTVP